jgi:hypothetical protein
MERPRRLPLALVFSLAPLPLVGGGCDPGGDTIRSAPGLAQRVTAADLDAVGRDEHLVVRQAPRMVYVFDSAPREIDFARVELLAHDGQRVDMHRALGALLNEHLVDALGAPDGHFLVAEDLADFGTLSPSEITAARGAGSWTKPRAKAPGDGPGTRVVDRYLHLGGQWWCIAERAPETATPPPAPAPGQPGPGVAGVAGPTLATGA